MKKKSRFLSLFLTLVLCVVLCVPAFASEYESTHDSYSGVTFWATLYADYETSFRGSTWAQSDTNLASKGVKVQARLYRNGIVCRATNFTDAEDTLCIVNTKSVSDDGEYYSQGLVEINGRQLPTYETSKFNKSRTMLNLLETLDENGDYPVNSKGEAYGSAMLASVVGYEPDLISAIGTDNAEGYLRLEDMYRSIRNPKEVATNMETYYEYSVLPLYNSEGEVIGTFEVDMNPVISANSMEEILQKIADGMPTPLYEPVELPQTKEELSTLVAKSPSKWAYPVNDAGLTYGLSYENGATYEPDLIRTFATNGKIGYVRRIEEKKAAYSDSINTIPVYDLDGNTIGEFEFDEGKTPTPTGTTAAQARTMKIQALKQELSGLSA